MRISVGKLRGLQQISDDTGRFTMIAMDQRGSLQKMLHPENPKAATYSEMEAVKLGVTEALAPHASGYLLDPEFGVAPAINRFALPGRTGLLAAHEPPRRVDRGEGEAARGECREAPAVLQSGRAPRDRGPPAEGREDDRG